MKAKMRSLLPDFAGKTIAALGLAFKQNTDDIRDSPAVEILADVIAAGARVRAYDPAAVDQARGVLGEERVVYCHDAYETAQGADLLVVFTESNQFRKLDLERIKGALASPQVVDCRNIYDPQKMAALGFRYVSVGR